VGAAIEGEDRERKKQRGKGKAPVHHDTGGVPKQAAQGQVGNTYASKLWQPEEDDALQLVVERYPLKQFSWKKRHEEFGACGHAESAAACMH
jgi:hypothetical protein